MERVNQNLYRSSRPGYKSHEVPSSTVAEWLAEVKNLGDEGPKVKTILCLLDDEQLAYYPDGLIDAYVSAGFSVVHRPVADHQEPLVPEKMLEQIGYDFAISEKPVLVHCSAGIGRTGAVVDHLSRTIELDDLNAITQTMLFHGSPPAALLVSPRPHTHSRHVTRLALQIFDQLTEKHRREAGFTPRDRLLLWAGGTLHDIGADPKVGNEPKDHAWRSTDLILNKHPAGIPTLGISSEEIATVAGLHRNKEIYPRITSLWDGKIPEYLRRLAAILRVADGCDHNLCQETDHIRISSNALSLHQANGEMRSATSDDRQRAQEKQRWLNELFGISVV